MSNPRQSNGALRRKYRARFKAMNAPCAICGRPINWDLKSCAANPTSGVIDEIRPVSKWRQFGYNSPREAAEDVNNIQPAHYRCNQLKGNKTNYAMKLIKPKENAENLRKNIPLDGLW